MSLAECWVGGSGLLPFALTLAIVVREVEDGGDHDRTIRRLGHWGSDSWIPFRRVITAADTGVRFSTLSVVLGPGDLTLSVVLGPGDLVLPLTQRRRTKSPSYSEDA
jgi:hypothetical protein